MLKDDVLLYILICDSYKNIYKTHVVPYILDADAAVPLLAPDSEGVDQQDDELSVLHTDGNHLSVGTVGGALGRMTQTNLVQKFLTQKTR